MFVTYNNESCHYLTKTYINEKNHCHHKPGLLILSLNKKQNNCFLFNIMNKHFFSVV